jgi:hypothetical protein
VIKSPTVRHFVCAETAKHTYVQHRVDAQAVEGGRRSG